MSPDLLPVLARGRHRNPRRGACFMEFASLLAGERWSDHPKCAHPVLAAIARSVNDCTTDDGRSALAPLVPAVIGTADENPRIGPELVRLSCRTALEQGDIRSRFVVSVGLLAAERQLDELDGRQPSSAESVLGELVSPAEVSDAERFVRGVRTSSRYYRRRGAQEAAVCAVLAMTGDPSPDTDVKLRELLSEAVELCRGYLMAPADPVDDPAGGPVDEAADEAWSRACESVGVQRGE